MPSTVHKMKFPAWTDGRRLGRLALSGGMLVCFWLVTISQSAAAKDYQSYEAALADGQKALRAKNYLAAQDPLEAAVKLAEDDGKRIKVYRMLFPVYELQPDIDDMLTACEFILDHSESSPEKSLTRGDLLDYVKKRDKADELVKHFQKRLEKNENDRSALFVLSEAYARLKDDPQQSAKYTERLAKAIEDSGEEVDLNTYAQLATQYVKSKQYQKGAELFEKIAPQDESTEPWNYKEAALAWLKAGEKEKALAAAKNATKTGPETRSNLMNYYWNNALGDVYLELKNPVLAIPHYESALKATKIQGYLKTTRESLAKAREAAK